MKKNLNKLIIISLISIFIIFILGCLAVKFSDFNLFSLTSNLFKEDKAAGVLLFPVTILADLGLIIFLGFILLVIPTGTTIIIFINQCIARLFQLGKEKQWKNTTSKVFTILSTSILIILVVTLSFVFLISLNLILLLLMSVIIVDIVLFIKEMKLINQTLDIIEK